MCVYAKQIGLIVEPESEINFDFVSAFIVIEIFTICEITG